MSTQLSPKAQAFLDSMCYEFESKRLQHLVAVAVLRSISEDFLAIAAELEEADTNA
jgi:hypothetical protein